MTARSTITTKPLNEVVEDNTNQGIKNLLYGFNINVNSKIKLLNDLRSWLASLPGSQDNFQKFPYQHMLKILGGIKIYIQVVNSNLLKYKNSSVLLENGLLRNHIFYDLVANKTFTNSGLKLTLSDDSANDTNKPTKNFVKLPSFYTDAVSEDNEVYEYPDNLMCNYVCLSMIECLQLVRTFTNNLKFQCDKDIVKELPFHYGDAMVSMIWKFLQVPYLASLINILKTSDNVNTEDVDKILPQNDDGSLKDIIHQDMEDTDNGSVDDSGEYTKYIDANYYA